MTTALHTTYTAAGLRQALWVPACVMQSVVASVRFAGKQTRSICIGMKRHPVNLAPPHPDEDRA